MVKKRNRKTPRYVQTEENNTFDQNEDLLPETGETRTCSNCGDITIIGDMKGTYSCPSCGSEVKI